jgi:translation initiation factor 1
MDENDPVEFGFTSFASSDPFADLEPSVTANELTESAPTMIHIRVQKRNGRKCITTVQGLDPNLDLKKILRTMKKLFCCNGSIETDPEFGDVLQMSGDMRQNVCEFLMEELQVERASIKIHGF